MWVGIQASIKCRACGGQAPIDDFDVAGPYPCLHCGIDQHMDPAQWNEAMEDAHDVADLAGAGSGAFPALAALKDNRYRSIGVQHVKAMIDTSYEVFESVPLHVDISPGNPVCESCHVPLEIVAAADPLKVRCPRCGQTHTYARPAGSPDDLVGVVSRQHEHGVRDVASDRDPGGAIAIRCPGCSAPLTEASVGAAIKCAYCGVICRVGPAMRRAVGANDARPPRWWALFRGPSQMRLRAVEQAEEAARDAAAKAERGRRAAEQRKHEATRQKTRRARDHKRNRAIRIWASVGIFVLGGVFVGLTYRASRPSVRPVRPATPPRTASAATLPTPEPDPSFTVEWKGKVTEADKGSSLAPGTPCRAEMTASGHDVTALRVLCGDSSLYDSRDRLNGMSNRGAAIIEAPGETGGHRYLLLYHDIGQRIGRSEIQFNSADKATVTSHGSPAYEVTMMFEDLSSERSGPPVFSTTIDTSHQLFTATVSSADGKAPARAGQRCTLDFYGRGVKADGNVCTAKLDCGSKNLYFTTAYCKLDGSNRPTTFSVQQNTSRFELDVGAGTVELAGETVDGVYTLRFALTPAGT